VSVGERLVVGRVRGFHGLRGNVRVESLTDRPAERFAVGRSLFLEGSERPLTIAEAEPDQLGWRLRFSELPDRTAAETIRDAYLEAVVAPGEELARGEFYWHEVVGASVVGLVGETLGKVVEVYRAGGGEVILVEGPRGELDIPLVRSVVRIFAPARGEIVVDVDALGLDEQPEGETDAGPATARGSTPTDGAPAADTGGDPG
jgi:16S rRNA processing protein RimM